MTEHRVLSNRENARLAILLFLTSLYFIYPTRQILLISALWAFIQICIGNAKRIPKKPFGLYIIRMSMYFLPYVVPNLVMGKIGENAVNAIANKGIILWCIGAALVTYIIWLSCNFKSIRILTSREYITGLKYIDKRNIALRLYTLIGAAICEETFFRGCILSVCAPIYLLYPLSISLFILAHWALPWGGMYSKKDLITELFVGVVNGGLYWLSHSILPGIILHLLINCTTNMDLLLQYDRWYLRKGYYDIKEKELEQRIDEELEL